MKSGLVVLFQLGHQNQNYLYKKNLISQGKSGDPIFLDRAIKRKKHLCNIDISYLKEIWKLQEGKCAFSGIPMKYIGETNDFNFLGSLDRKDSSKGYVKGNVQFVICALNLAKGNRSDDKIFELIKLLKNHS